MTKAPADAAATPPAACPPSPLTAPTDAGVINAAVAGCPIACPRCHAPITAEQLKAIFTSAPDDKINGVRDAFNEAFEKFAINHCVRKAHFFAQCREEIGPSMNFEENMKYTPEQLKSLFGYFKKNPDEADTYGRVKGGQSADEEQIANHAYADRNGNGDVASGDGYKYRGGGLIQVTGKGNYEDVQKEIDAKDSGSGVDIGTRPDDIRTPKGATLAGMGYWSKHGLNGKSEAGATGAVVDSITRVVNKSTKSYAQRRAHFVVTKSAKVFRVAECVNLISNKKKGKGKGKGKGKK